MADDVKVLSIGDAFKKVECYTANISELAAEIDDEFVKDDGNFIELNFNGAIKLLNTFWAKVKETAQECEGKEIRVKMPDGLFGNILGAILGVVGIKL